uniref:(California timema) hypothetical protein n=1 Tax=Timema californicum TaxID=61474 RepID=A0A7R9IVR1_TIMCA|nr:unnamed protein product [Timema californicum]
MDKTWLLLGCSVPDSFVNSQEWTLSRNVPDLRLGIVGSLSSGKSALVHRYLTGSYMQEESPEGGRFKKEILVDGQSYLLLIRDEGGPPELQIVDDGEIVVRIPVGSTEGGFPLFFYRNAGILRHPVPSPAGPSTVPGISLPSPTSAAPSRVPFLPGNYALPMVSEGYKAAAFLHLVSEGPSTTIHLSCFQGVDIGGIRSHQGMRARVVEIVRGGVSQVEPGSGWVGSCIDVSKHTPGLTSPHPLLNRSTGAHSSGKSWGEKWDQS